MAAALELAHGMQYRRSFAEARRLYEEIERALARSTADESLRARLRLHIGLTWLREGDLRRAEEAFRIVLRRHPELPGARRIARFPAIMARSLANVPVHPLPLSDTQPRVHPLALGKDVVYFFVSGDDITADADYWHLFAASILSARAAIPGSRVVLVTDERTRVEPRVQFDVVLRAGLPPGELMPNRFRAIRHYLAHVMERPGAHAALLIEADCLVMRDPFDALGNADILLTHRSNFVDEAEDLEPCNAGVMLLDLRRPAALEAFFLRCLDAFPVLESWPEMEGLFTRPIRAWRGDQLAIGAVVGWTNFMRHILSENTDRLDVGGCTVGFLPSDPYNFTFDPAVERGALADKFVVHYKGTRKRFLLEGRTRSGAGGR